MMELDELKKSWSVLDSQISRKPITDEQQIARLITRYKGNTRKSLRNLIGFQRFSLGIGILAIVTCLGIGYYIHTGTGNATDLLKAYTLLAFFGLTMLGAIWRDYHTLRWTRGIRVDEMTVAEVSRRMVVLRRWTCHEIWILYGWTVCFDLLYCWTIGLFAKGIWTALLTLFVLLLIQIPAVWLFYKKVIYKHLNNIKANIEELNDVCTE